MCLRVEYPQIPYILLELKIDVTASKDWACRNTKLDLNLPLGLFQNPKSESLQKLRGSHSWVKFLGQICVWSSKDQDWMSLLCTVKISWQVTTIPSKMPYCIRVVPCGRYLLSSPGLHFRIPAYFPDCWLSSDPGSHGFFCPLSTNRKHTKREAREAYISAIKSQKKKKKTH